MLNPFLACALALPLLSFAHMKTFAPMNEDMPSHITLAHFLKQEKRILLVGGDPYYVTIFRKAGLKAYGALTEDRAGVTPYHIVTEPKTIGFVDQAFQAVYWFQKNPFGSSGLMWLAEATRLVEVGGFLVFPPDPYPDWIEWLRHRPFDRMPFKMNGFIIYQKRRAINGRGLREITRRFA